MGLAFVATNTISSAVNSVALVGIETDDVYMVVFHNVGCATDNKNINFQIGTSGTADSDSEYDFAFKVLQATADESNGAGVNASSFTFAPSMGNAEGETLNGIMFLYNFNNSSAFSFGTIKSIHRNLTPDTFGYQGGFVHTVAEANNSVHFTAESSSNMDSGTFTLYKVT